MTAELFHIIVVTGHVPAQKFNLLAYLLGAFFNLQRAQTLQDGLQIGVKRGGRNYDDTLVAKGVLQKGARINLNRSHLIDEQVVINAFGRDEHKSEIHRAVLWFDVFGGFVNAFFQIQLEIALQSDADFFVLFLHDTVVVFQRKFRVHWNYFIFYKDNGVHNIAVGKTVLHLIRFGRENVFEYQLQLVLAQNP